MDDRILKNHTKEIRGVTNREHPQRTDAYDGKSDPRRTGQNYGIIFRYDQPACDQLGWIG